MTSNLKEMYTGSKNYVDVMSDSRVVYKMQCEV